MRLHKITAFLALLPFLFIVSSHNGVHSAPPTPIQSNYCYIPPFLTTAVPPLVMFVLGRDHKLYYEAYNDASDIDEDGIIDVGYKHNITYYGYFDSNKCYKYDTTGTPKFYPVRVADEDNYCGQTGEWSGNFLNWLSMSRMDIIRKVMFGGYRSSDSAGLTVLEGAYIPQDAHSWGKEYKGNDVNKLTPFANLPNTCSNSPSTVCNSNSDCNIYKCSLETTQACSTSADCFKNACSLNTSLTCTSNSDCSYLACSNSPSTLCTSHSDCPITPGICSNDNTISCTSSSQCTKKYCSNNPSITCNINADCNVWGTCSNNSSISCISDSNCAYNYCSKNPSQSCDPSANSGAGDCPQYCRNAPHTNTTCTTSQSGRCGGVNYVCSGNNNVTAVGSNSTQRNNYCAGLGLGSSVNSCGPRDPCMSSTGSCSGSSGTCITQTGTCSSGPGTCQTMSDSCVSVSTGSCQLQSTGTCNEIGQRHLFCITSTSDSAPHRIRVATADSNRIWDWASTERAVCSGPDTSSSYRRGPVGTRSDIQDFIVRVEVCKNATDLNGNSLLESNCKEYSGQYKPIGLLQKYGEGRNDGAKVCSKVPNKSCNTDSDCTTGQGLCIEKSQMYYGLFTGTYEKNMSGGILRKNIWTILDETNYQTGYFQTSESTQGNIIQTVNKMRIAGFRYSDFSYQASAGGTCGWITERGLNEGECKDWGNPIGEAMYEAMRFIAGKGTPTSAFVYGTGSTTDSSIGLSKRDWGIQKGSTIYQPYDLFPSCAKPFLFVISDVSPSYDHNQIPGSAFNTYTGDLPNLNAATLTNIIGTDEGIAGGNWNIGRTSSVYDFICSKKYVSNLSTIRGLCPEEPTKNGSFYSAAAAYYGRTLFATDTGKPNITTYSIALASPVPDISIKVDGKTTTIVPVGKSPSGCLNVYQSCASKCTLSSDANGLQITGCTSSAYCPTNQIVDFYVDTILYDVDKNITYAKFRINFEDVEQGADHDMDSIVLYEICSGSSCSPAISSNQIKLKLTSSYAAGCIDQVLGFNISGTTEDGVYLVVKDKDVSSSDSDTPAVVANLPLSWEKTFTVTGTATGILKDPLWYAAKWGGFEDLDGNGKPNLTNEWDKFNNLTGIQGSDGIPDTYFKVVNPLKMEQQMERAFNDIMRRASSGTTVVSMPPTQSRESFVLAQTFFYPERYDGSVALKWIGYLRLFWADVVGNLRENTDETNENSILKFFDLIKDKIMAFIFSSGEQNYVVKIFTDADGDSTPDACTSAQVSTDTVKPIWEAASLLKLTAPDSRNIKVWLDSNNDNIVNSGEYVDFTTALASSLQSVWSYDSTDLSTCTTDCAYATIKYLRGYDRPTDSSGNAHLFRVRQAESTAGYNIESSWKLGDIIFSTPKISPNRLNNGYDVRYRDNTYRAFYENIIKDNPIIAIVGANDGMIHAFRVGTLEEIKPASTTGGGKQISKLTSTSTTLGAEEWAFIPKNVLPYLRWYCQENYCHIPMADNTFTIVDASIGDSSSTATGIRTALSWRRLLVGTMGFGGNKITVSGTTYSSSVFVLDITNPLSPALLWEKNLPNNALTSGTPGIVRLGASDTNGSWYVVIGSGPHTISTQSLTYLSSPKIFVFDLKTGTEMTGGGLSVSGASNVGFSDFLAVDADLPLGDYQTDALYFGTYGGTGSSQTGALYRIRIRNGDTYYTNPAQWVVSQVVNTSRPVFAAPSASVDTNYNRWLYFGTGLYVTLDHAITTNEKFYGVKESDACWKTGSGCVAYTNFLDTSSFTFSGAKAVKVNCQCDGGVIKSIGYCSPAGTCPTCSEGVMTVLETTDAVLTASGDAASCSSKQSNEAVRCLESVINNKNGWVQTVTNGKIYSSPFTGGGIVSATVFSPTDDPCQYGGTSDIIALHYTTGTSFYSPAIQSQSGTTGSTSSLAISKRVQVAVGPPPFKQSLVPLVTGPNYKVFTQASGGIAGVGITPSLPIMANKYILWLTK